MTRDEFDAYCGAMKGAAHVVQWGGASVWKIGGKIFAIASSKAMETAPDRPRISFKCSELAYEILPGQQGIIPAPHLARAKWVQITSPDAMSDDDIKLHLDAAYDIIAGKLPKRVRKDLKLDS